MNILVISSFVIPHVGGLSTHVQLLVAGLRGRGHDVRLVEGGSAASSKWARVVYRLATYPSRDRYRARVHRRLVAAMCCAIEEEIGQWRPDLIHSHDPYASEAAVRAIGSTGIPLVQTVHGPALYEAKMSLGENNPSYFACIRESERQAMTHSARLIAVDRGQAGILASDYKVPVAKVVVIGNCVDVMEVRRLGSATGEQRVNGVFFLVPRRLVAKTGVRYAIEALAKMSNHEAHLVIAGDGPQRQELEDLAQHLGIRSRMRFLGSVAREKLLPLFGRAVGVIVPSVPSAGVIEATSLAVTEAMAAGSVPLASSIGGLAELIEDGVTGILVPPGDPARLAQAMDRLVSDSDYRNRIIVGATRKVETDYSAESWLDRIERVYRDVVVGQEPAKSSLAATNTQCPIQEI